MPLAGKGGLQGLLDGPTAMTIAADGRILILETGTQYIKQPRIQAFDVKGNPVPSFSVNQPSFTIANGSDAIIGELDQRKVSLALLRLFQQNFTPALAPKVVLKEALSQVAGDLDKGIADDTLIAKLQDHGLAGKDAKTSDFTVTVTKPGSLWFVTDKVSSATYDVRLGEDPGTGFNAIDVYLQFGLAITIRSPGHDWKVDDFVNAMTFKIIKAADILDAHCAAAVVADATAQAVSDWDAVLS